MILHFVYIFLSALTHTSEIINTSLKNKHLNIINNFNPQHVYEYTKALRIAKHAQTRGNEFLKAADSTNNVSTKLDLLNQAGKYFDYGALGIWYHDHMNNSQPQLHQDPVSLYLKTYSSFLTLSLKNNPMNVLAFTQPLATLKILLGANAQLLDNAAQESLNAMLIESYGTTASPLLLKDLLSTQIIYNPEVISSVWDGLKIKKSGIFIDNLMEINKNPAFLQFFNNKINHPLFFADFYLTCIKHRFNSFTMTPDIHIYRDLTDLIRNTSSFERLTDLIHSFFFIPEYVPDYQCQPLINSLLDIADCYPIASRHLYLIDIATRKDNFDHLTFNRMIPHIAKSFKNPALRNLDLYLQLFEKWISDAKLIKHVNPINHHLFEAYYYAALLHKELESSRALSLPQLQPIIESAQRNTKKWLSFLTHDEASQEDFEEHHLSLNADILGFALITQEKELLKDQAKYILHDLSLHTQNGQTWGIALDNLFSKLYEKRFSEFNAYLNSLSEAKHNDPYIYFSSILSFLAAGRQLFPESDDSSSPVKHFIEELSLLAQKNEDGIHSSIIYNAVKSAYKKYGDKEFLCIMRDNESSMRDFALGITEFIERIRELKTEEIQEKIRFLQDSGIIDKILEHEEHPDALTILGTLEELKIKKRLAQNKKEYKTNQQAQLATLKKYITLMESESFQKSNPLVASLMLSNLKTTHELESLCWALQFDSDHAIDLYQNMLFDKQIHRKTLTIAEAVLTPLNYLKTHHTDQFDIFMQKIVAQSENNPKMQLLASLVASQTDPKSFSAIIDVFKQSSNWLLGMSLAQCLKKRNATAKEWTIFADTVSEKLNELFILFKEEDPKKQQANTDLQINILKFLQTISNNCACPQIELALLKMKKLQDEQCTRVTLYLKKPIDDELGIEGGTKYEELFAPDFSLSNAEDILHRLLNQISINIPAEGPQWHKEDAVQFQPLHTIMDKYIACNFFQEALKYCPSEVQPYYKLLYAQILYNASRMQYTKLMPKDTPYESMMAQLIHAKNIITTVLQLNKRQKYIANPGVYLQIIHRIEAFRFKLMFHHKPEECMRFLTKEIEKCDVGETNNGELPHIMNMCYHWGLLQEYLKYLETKSLADKENAVASYTAYSVAINSQDEAIRETHLQKTLHYAQAIAEYNELTTLLSMSIYLGKCNIGSINMTNLLKAEALQKEHHSHSLDKYKNIYKTCWEEEFPNIERSIKNGNSILAVIIAEIFIQNYEYSLAQDYLEAAELMERNYANCNLQNVFVAKSINRLKLQLNKIKRKKQPLTITQ